MQIYIYFSFFFNKIVKIRQTYLIIFFIIHHKNHVISYQSFQYHVNIILYLESILNRICFIVAIYNIKKNIYFVHGIYIKFFYYNKIGIVSY